MTTYILDSLVRSILIGSLYSLMAIGLTLTYASSRFPNFAHGELVMIGAYVSALMNSVIGFGPSVLIAAISSACAAAVMYRFVISPLMVRVRRILFLMLATFAIGLVVRSFVALLADHFRVMTLKAHVEVVPVLHIANVGVTNFFIWTVPTALVLVFGLHFFLSRTKMGRMMRAASDNPDLALVCGIDTERTSALSWSIAGALAGIAGSLWAVYAYVFPDLGWLLILSIFASSVIGGLTSFSGTIAGGYMLGLAENLFMDTLNVNFGVDYGFKPLIAFSAIVVVLLVRPKGLADLSLGRFSRKKWR
jgi:branched-subunit amino acid ABC-type transport system permease component